MLSEFSENEQLEVNETDDNKVKKVGRRKGSKRKGETAKQWDQLQFSVNLLEGHDHPLCSVDANENIIVSAGFVVAYFTTMLYC